MPDYSTLAADLRRLKPFSADMEQIAQLAVLRDARIRDALTDKDSIVYRAGAFLAATVGGRPDAARFCREQKIPMTKASATAPNTAGGFLVPEETADAIAILIEQFGVARAEARVWRMASDRLTVPRMTSGFTMAWVNENSTASYQTPGFDGAGLTVRKLAGYVKISSELMDDAIGAFGAAFIEGAALGFAKAEDTALFTGDGSPTSGGVNGIEHILGDGSHAGKITATSGHATFATLDSTDIGNAIAALPARALANAKLYVSVTGYGAALVRLGGANGGLVATIENGKLRANWHGLPVVITSALPTSTGSLSGKLMMAVGDMRQAAAVGVRRDMSVRAFPETLAEIDQVLIRATERVDINPHDLGDNTNPGALVGLFAP